MASLISPMIASRTPMMLEATPWIRFMEHRALGPLHTRQVQLACCIDTQGAIFIQHLRLRLSMRKLHRVEVRNLSYDSEIHIFPIT